MTESISRKFSRLGLGVSETGTLTVNSATATKWATARTLTLSGDLSGNVSIDGSDNVTLTATVSGNTVALGTDTTGDYVASVAAGTGITTTGTGEGAAVTVALSASGVTANSYGSSTAVPVLTIDTYGRITSASTASVSSSINIAGDTGTDSVSLISDTLTVAGGTGLTSTVTNNTVTLDIDNTVTTLTGSQTLTNKTLTSPVISSITNTGTLTLPTSTDTLVGRATSDTLTNKTISGADNTISNIGNASLTNSSITINGTSVSLGGTRTLVTDDVAEDGSPINLWYTDARARSAITVTDAGGDGSLSYVSGTGVITYTGPSASEVRAHFSAGTGVTITSGQISIGQAVATTDNVTFAGVTVDNIRVGVTAVNEIDTSTGNLVLDSTGGTTTIDDDATVTGNLQIDGNLTVSGTTVTMNTTTLSVEDNMIYLNSGSAVANPDLGFAGNYNDGTYRHAGLFRDASDGVFKFFHQYTPEPDAAAYIDTTHGSFALAPIQASTFTGNVTGDVTGNASTATTWQTARTLTLTGDVTGTSASFNGSGNISISTTIAADSVALGTDTTGNYVASITNGNYITGGNGGSEGAALTLAVDATSANTASKVVARDASGNFSAGTITATLSGNASTVTNGVYTTDTGTVTNTMLAGSIANAKLANSTISGISLGSNLATLTLGVSGTGLSGSQTYNGSGAATFTVTSNATSANTGSTIVARDASGNFSAGTITATLSGNSSTVGGLSPAQFFNNMGNNHNTYTDFNNVPGFGTYYVQQGGNSPTGTTSHQWYGFTIGLGNEYALSSYATQFYWPRRAQNSDTYIYVRDREGGTWTSWAKIKAGYADTAGALTSMNISQFTNNSGYITGLSFDGLSSKTGGTGTYTTTGDFRAPIFYDQNDTSYYLDPASDLSLKVYGEISNSNYVPGNLQPGALNIGRTDTNYRWDGSSWSGDVRLGILANCTDYWEFGIHDSGERVVSPLYYVGGANNYFLMGRSIGWGSSPIVADNSFRAPVFYDSDNTSYYLDPASTSTSLNIAGVINTTAPGGSILIRHSVSEVDAWLFMENASNWGLYWKNAPSGQHTFGGYNSVGAELFGMSAANSSGNGVLTSNYVGATSAYAQWMLSNYTGYMWSASTVFAAGDMRSPIFYDSNNTGYYCDPASTSILNIVNTGNKLYINNGGESVATSSFRGIQFHVDSDMSYYIGKPAGAWTQPLHIYFYTGIRLLSHQSYGGTQFYNISSGSTVMAVNNGDNNVHVYTNLYSPIIYDENDTGYYLDPNGTTRIYNLTMAGAKHTYLNIAPGNGYEAMVYYDGGGSGSPWYVGKRTTSQVVGTESFHFYSVAASRTLAGVDTSGNMMSDGSMRSPVFYDYNDTGYYYDPNSTSDSAGRQRGGTLYGPNVSWGAYLYVGTNSRVGSTATVAVSNGNLHMDCADGYGMYLNYYSGNVIYGTDFRPYIIYDRDDTTYYVNPNGTSYMYRTIFQGRMLFYGGDQSADGTNDAQLYFTAGGGLTVASITTTFETGFVGSSYPNNRQAGAQATYDKRFYVWQDLVQYYSDERLKEKTGTLAGALDAIKSWTPFKYVDNALANSFNFGSDKPQIGLSAQEVQQYYPELVELAPFDVQNDFSDETNPRRVSKSGENYLTLNYTRLVPVLVQAIKEQQAKIEELERRINNS